MEGNLFEYCQLWQTENIEQVLHTAFVNKDITKEELYMFLRMVENHNYAMELYVLDQIGVTDMVFDEYLEGMDEHNQQKKTSTPR